MAYTNSKNENAYLNRNRNGSAPSPARRRHHIHSSISTRRHRAPSTVCSSTEALFHTSATPVSEESSRRRRLGLRCHRACQRTRHKAAAAAAAAVRLRARASTLARAPAVSRHTVGTPGVSCGGRRCELRSESVTLAWRVDSLQGRWRLTHEASVSGAAGGTDGGERRARSAGKATGYGCRRKATGT